MILKQRKQNVIYLNKKFTCPMCPILQQNTFIY